MAQLGVSPTTVRQAVSDLVRAGRIDAISGSGTFIRAPLVATAPPPADTSWQALALGSDNVGLDLLEPLRAPPPAGVIDLASGYPDASLQPTTLLRRAVRDAVRRPGTFGRAPSEGIAPLRAWFTDQIDPSSDRSALITGGGQAALSLTFRALGLPGDTILMESPTYVGALMAARGAGLIPAPVSVDTGGLRVDHLEAAVRATGATLLYVQPRFHNPTGAVLADNRRSELLAIADRHRLIIVEDDWIADLDDHAARLKPLAAADADGHVVHIRSLTKSVAPSIRIACVAASGHIAARIRRMRATEDFFVSPLLQEIALGVVTAPQWPTHLARLRQRLAQRRTDLTNRLPAPLALPDGSAGGPLHVWARLPDTVRDTELRDVALRHGVLIVPGSQWHPADPGAAHIRLSCAAVGNDLLALGVARLGEALAELGA